MGAKKTAKSEEILFNGVTFRRYPDSSRRTHRVYYSAHTSNNASPIWLHQELWKSIHGKIPKGSHIHHKDRNPLNNSIDNLICLTKMQHAKEHHDEAVARGNTPKQKAIFKKAQNAARKWHKSKEGKEWHKVQAVKNWKKRKPKMVKCAFCGDKYETLIPHRAKFCTSLCRQRSYVADGRYADRVRKK